MIVHYGQTLIDIAIQEYGSLAAVFQLAKDNGLEVDADLVPGTVLMINDTPTYSDPDLVNYFKRNGIKINQGQLNLDIEILSTNDNEPLNIQP
jgi:hypothetical protein